MKKNWFVTLIIGLISLGLVILLAVALTQNPSAANNALIGKPATDFSALDIHSENSSFNLSSYKGHPVILNFWASWCLSCREEARELEAFHRKYGDHIKVIGIAVQDEKNAAVEFAKTYQKSYLLGLDTTGRINVDYGVVGVPETFYINAEGVILHKEVGPVTLNMLETYFAKYLPSKN